MVDVVSTRTGSGGLLSPPPRVSNEKVTNTRYRDAEGFCEAGSVQYVFTEVGHEVTYVTLCGYDERVILT